MKQISKSLFSLLPTRHFQKGLFLGAFTTMILSCKKENDLPLSKKDSIVNNERVSLENPKVLKGASSVNSALSSTSPVADIESYFPTLDVDKTESIEWIVLANRAGLFSVKSTETVTVKKGDISGFAHNGSMIANSTIGISWSEGTVQTSFTPRVALASVKGTITVGLFSAPAGGLLTLNARNF